jgi:phage gpG-like protein
LIVEIHDNEARVGLIRLQQGLANPKPILQGAGEYLATDAKERIRAGGPAPDGTAWKPLSPLTLALKKGPGILREKGYLLDSIAYQLAGETAVAIGARMIYARIQQRGGTIKPRKGKALRIPGLASPRGSVTIPARPYVGVSERGRAVLEKKILLWLQKLAQG